MNPGSVYSIKTVTSVFGDIVVNIHWQRAYIIVISSSPGVMGELVHVIPPCKAWESPRCLEKIVLLVRRNSGRERSPFSSIWLSSLAPGFSDKDVVDLLTFWGSRITMNLTDAARQQSDF
ncbi:hypothetical protein TNCV_3467901 [Trichonephila clavipes]|nr:hypothetical protein TNCV_3467901 [Trichonephila clavipes]